MAKKEAGYIPRLKQRYLEQVVPALTKQFNHTNVMAVPRVEKVVINVGMGEGSQDIKLLDRVSEELAAITGQKPVVTRAKKAIAGFKLREGMPIGAMVTLRGDRMYEFLDRLLNVALPRVRDFRGVSPRAFDGRGNYTIGVKDQLIFPEIDIGKTERIHGMNVSIVTTAKSDEQARFLLGELGMPFTKPEERRAAVAVG
ncbi:MAG: 50S ribosomal protein L5 [Acidobacteriota bacterium]